jgi:enoyl-CoA hydratase/carnithine racemase
MQGDSVPTTVSYERTGHLGYITLDRPQVLNAMNDALVRDLRVAVATARDDGDARVVIMRGAGRAFCAGADLKESPVKHALPDYRAGRMADEQDVTRLFRSLDKPVIAQLHGAVIGGGVVLAMLADLRVAARGTRFEMPEVRVGATVSFGGLYHLPRIIGLGRAFELMYLADAFDEAEALRLGLVNRVAPAEELAAVTRAMAEKIASHFPLELALTRHALYRGLDADFPAAVEGETAAALISYAAGAREEGMARAMRGVQANRPA